MTWEIHHKSYAMIVVSLSLPVSPLFLLIRYLLLLIRRCRLLQQMFRYLRCLGSAISPDQWFVLTFNGDVVAATINGFSAIGSGLNWRASPALTSGSVFLNVE